MGISFQAQYMYSWQCTYVEGNQNVCHSPLSDRNKNFKSKGWHLGFKSVILAINGIGTGEI
jgi:hypothetical protein